MIKYIYIILILAVFSSCKVLHPSRMFTTKADFEYSEFEDSCKEYSIKPFDKLDIKIYTNDGNRLIDVKGGTVSSTGTVSYLVEHDGMVKIPILGRVNISGMTIREAEDMLETKYSEHYIKPFVILNVTNRRVVVFSSGSTSGSVIQLPNDNYTLIEALAQAGGISDFSKAYRIKLIRGELNNPEVYLFNMSSIEKIKKVNFLLEANDIIYVDSRSNYGSKVFKEISPYLTLVTTLILLYQAFQ